MHKDNFYGLRCTLSIFEVQKTFRGDGKDLKLAKLAKNRIVSHISMIAASQLMPYIHWYEGLLATVLNIFQKSLG